MKLPCLTLAKAPSQNHYSTQWVLFKNCLPFSDSLCPLLLNHCLVSCFLSAACFILFFSLSRPALFQLLPALLPKSTCWPHDCPPAKRGPSPLRSESKPNSGPWEPGILLLLKPGVPFLFPFPFAVPSVPPALAHPSLGLYDGSSCAGPRSSYALLPPSDPHRP